MKEILLALLMGMLPHNSDTETVLERRDRMEIVAAAMTDAVNQATCSGSWSSGCTRRWRSPRKYLAAALLVQGENESHFARRIQAGDCKPDECDPTMRKRLVLVDGRVRKHTVVDADGNPIMWHAARGIWQVHSSYLPANISLWENANGLTFEATTSAAMLAVFYLSACQCGGNFEQMFTAQDGKGCGRVSKSGKFRAGELVKYVVKYEREWRKLNGK